jgi:hypothetical protein
LPQRLVKTGGRRGRLQLDKLARYAQLKRDEDLGTFSISNKRLTTVSRSFKSVLWKSKNEFRVQKRSARVGNREQQSSFLLRHSVL